ncbi:succinate dehydrogenase, hydrophobic membrane anchor protein [Candidatus Endowatersipora endosymbiont of Watersipora subatra]|uniref:succinate dehydrogenase, hydrophobic membrane anchor protein n=1 Tax=Candidatus Endowatersipora endosymbiont of Watersipora subatra TaxID=3077946 RepID=UPI00312C9F47
MWLTKGGTGHFCRQRLTAIANVPLILFFLLTLIRLNGASYEQTVSYLSQPLVTFLMLLFLGSSIYHMKLGMQIIIEDYVHGYIRKLLTVLNISFCIILAFSGSLAMVRLTFEG